MKKYEITLKKHGKDAPYYSEIISEDKLFYDLPRAGCSEYTHTTADDLLDNMMRLAVDNAGAEDAEEAARIIKTTVDDFFAAIPTEDKKTRLDDLHALQWLKGTGESGCAIGSDPVKIIRDYFNNLQDAETWEIKEARE